MRSAHTVPDPVPDFERPCFECGWAATAGLLPLLSFTNAAATVPTAQFFGRKTKVDGECFNLLHSYSKARYPNEILLTPYAE